MTAKELAARLSGRKVGNEITDIEAQQAADAGLVVVFGYSDDNVELRGAIDAEVGAYEGTTIFVDSDGIMYEPPCDGQGCRYYEKALKACKTINAIWGDGSGPCWKFDTQIPHETFDIYEDGEVWCVGIVFSMEHLGT